MRIPRPVAAVALTIVFTMILGACGAFRSESASDRPLLVTPTPTAEDTGSSVDSGGTSTTPTPTPIVVPTTAPDTSDAEPDPTVTPDEAEPTATPTSIPPIPTVAPTSTSTPTPQPTATPRPTATPQPTATPFPTSTPTATHTPVLPHIDCSIAPVGTVVVEEPLVFTASASPGNVSLQFAFDHGDGTIDPGAVSNAYYAAPGTYAVKLRWSGVGTSGVVDCGNVVVIAQTDCRIGLGPADGLGWWCGSLFCPANDPIPAVGCPSSAPYGCYQGMDGAMYCILPPGGGDARRCLVGDGTDGRTGWVCDGRYCPPGGYGCPPYPIYGCFLTVGGHTICIDPAPDPVISCTISKNDIVVGETTVFTAIQTGIEVAVDFVFDHGDGTLDPRAQAIAYYAAPGDYDVVLNWSWAGGSGQVACGTVTVSASA